MGTRLWRVGADLQAINLLSLAVGLTVRTVVAELHDQPEMVTTKWPNDVYIGDAKLCGILIETHKAQHGDYWAAIGIGVNLALAPHVPDGRQAAMLSGVKTAPTPEQFLAVLDVQLSQLLNSWPPGDPQQFCRSWSRSAFGIGTAVRLQSGEGGVFSGIETDGAARVMLDSGGQTSVHAGDLVFMSLEKARNAASD
jgi:BirA family biotin operon repressor/biotin-[acetyl-CoA-carboxylase] ligase